MAHNFRVGDRVATVGDLVATVVRVCSDDLVTVRILFDGNETTYHASYLHHLDDELSLMRRLARGELTDE